MAPIDNYKVYTSGMEKSMEDKLFWLKKIAPEEYGFVFDYGCADGTFLHNVRKINSHCRLIGLDIDDSMLEKAKEKLGNEDVLLANVKTIIGKPYHLYNEVLNLSSIIHEIYSYSDSDEIERFWEFVWSGFKYVCIRDMCVDDYLCNINNTFKLKYVSEEEMYRRKEFEKTWGSLNNMYNFLHYMLKYRYVENWSREVEENYLPLSYESLLHCMPDNYECIYHEHYTLPFLKEQVKKDWDIDLIWPTHCKLIFKRKD